MMHVGDIIVLMISLSTEHPNITQDIPHICHDIPKVLNTPMVLHTCYTGYIYSYDRLGGKDNLLCLFVGSGLKLIFH